MDFAVFPYIKLFLRGQRFDDLPELRQEVMNIILNMKTEQFEKIFDDWLKRKYVPVHYLGVVSLGLDWQLNKDVSFSELVPNLASVPNKINRLFTVLHL
jgi:hypothetical protein